MTKHHSAYWMTFKGHAAACMEAPSEEEARADAAELTGSEVITCDRLPCPATPRLRPYKDEKYGVCPAFCFRPKECKGKTACPQNYSCTE